MADMARRMCGPEALTSTPDTVIEVPGGVQWIMRNIHVANGDPTTTALFAMGHSYLDVDHALFYTEVPPYGVLDWSGFMVLNDGETLLAAALSGALTLTISGVEVTTSP